MLLICRQMACACSLVGCRGPDEMTRSKAELRRSAVEDRAHGLMLTSKHSSSVVIGPTAI